MANRSKKSKKSLSKGKKLRSVKPLSKAQIAFDLEPSTTNGHISALKVENA